MYLFKKPSDERIVSTGHANPDGFWFDQDEYEWLP
jgi:hypothetical protein